MIIYYSILKCYLLIKLLSRSTVLFQTAFQFINNYSLGFMSHKKLIVQFIYRISRGSCEKIKIYS